MPRKKQRVVQHIMEEESIRILGEKLPQEWVIHKYAPDYGIDVVIEVFKYIGEKVDVAETLGETFFAQLKSIKKEEISKITVEPRINVEKRTLTKAAGAKAIEMDVIAFPLDTVELNTIEAMGAGAPVLLLLFTLDSRRAFFVCLSDYIDKILVPEDPNFADKGKKTIYVPVQNEFRRDKPESLAGLRLYAKRAKLLFAFSKFIYQFAELGYEPVDRDLVLHFIGILKRLDIWADIEFWAIIPMYYERLLALEGSLLANEQDTLLHLKAIAVELWRRLSILPRNHEELCREWFLPSHLAQISSYPEMPSF